MALTTRQRTTLYTAIADAIGTEEAGLLLDQFPAREGDELITRDHLATGLAEVRTEIAGVRTEIARMENRLYVAMVSISVVAIGVVTALTR